MNHDVRDAPAVFGFGQEIEVTAKVETRWVRDFFVAGGEDLHLGAVSGDNGGFDVGGGDILVPCNRRAIVVT